jgi:DegV family protein with EDD domain
VLYIDGPCLVSALVSGAHWVARERSHLNEINVFPVPDGDTGTNLAITLRAAANAVSSLDDPSLTEVCDALSDSVLIEAHGNAGIILAQFLRVFAQEARGRERLSSDAFASVLQSAVRGAYEAMAAPVEGTILTVLRESAEEATRLVSAGERDFLKLLTGMHRAAAASLARTPELLPVLKEAGVVDAGGEGFLDLLTGVLRMLRGERVEDVLDRVPQTSTAVRLNVSERDLKYRYCTEFMLEGPDADPGMAKVRLVGLGGSLMAIGSQGLVRVHIHTNSPRDVFKALQGMGEVHGRKIDDMRRQHRDFVRGFLEADALASEPVREARGDRSVELVSGRRHGDAEAGTGVRVRVVTDSSADLSDEDVAELGITVVPLTLTFESGESYRSGVDLSTSAFYRMLDASSAPPTTSQPSPDDFARCYRELQWVTRHVLSIHISSGMSGTFHSAQKAARLIRSTEIVVVDSQLASAPLGMVVIAAARAARDGADLDELRTLVSSLCERARVYFTVGSLGYLVRGGRIGRARAALGVATGVMPILTIRDGVVARAGLARGRRGVLESMLRLARADLHGAAHDGSDVGDGRRESDAIGMLGLVHASSRESAEKVQRAFMGEFGFDEVKAFELGGIVGTHVGPGTWGVSYFMRTRRPVR